MPSKGLLNLGLCFYSVANATLLGLLPPLFSSCCQLLLLERPVDINAMSSEQLTTRQKYAVELLARAEEEEAAAEAERLASGKPGRSASATTTSVRSRLKKKKWGLSQDEVGWIMTRRNALRQQEGKAVAAERILADREVRKQLKDGETF